MSHDTNLTIADARRLLVRTSYARARVDYEIEDAAIKLLCRSSVTR